MGTEEVRRAANRMIRAFQQEFFQTFKVYPVVSYQLKEDELPRVDLFVLEDLVNEVYQKDHPHLYSMKGIRDRHRKRKAVIYRQTFMYIAQALGHGPYHTGKHLRFNHATAIYARRTIQGLLDSRDIEVTSIYNNVIHEYKKRFSDDGALQQDGEERHQSE